MKSKNKNKLIEESTKKSLNKKLEREKTTENNLDEEHDSSDEELLVRTGKVPKKWYDGLPHSGYNINAEKVIKPKKEDEIEKFIKQAEDKNWWRNIYDDMNNKSIYISDTDLEIIQRIRKNLFANKAVQLDDYFEKDIPYQIHPLSNHLPSKKGYEMSKSERKAINRIVYAIKHGFIKLDEDKEHKEEIIKDIWEYENTDPSLYHPMKGFQAPKKELPDSNISYNPPPELIDENTKKYDSLRKMPKYEKLIEENFERCCDLFLSARIIKKIHNIKAEDILPNLPKPEELKPFPTKVSIIYRGHESSVRAITLDNEGKFLISGDSAGFLHFWDVQTAKIIKRIDVSDSILDINYNQIMNIIVVCCKQSIYFVIPIFVQKSIKNDITNLFNSKIIPLIKEKSTQENTIYEWKTTKENSKKFKHGILFYIKWKEGVLEGFSWHNKGDYFATLSKNSAGKSKVYIHSLSKLVHQTPFSKIKGQIKCISFHPIKPYFIVATNSNIFIYNLQKQEMIRKFVSNLNTITNISVHKNGEDLIAGSKDGKVAWFQIELSEKPYKIMDYHNDKIKVVSFHHNYPLFQSASKTGKILIYHSTVYHDLIQDPLIVPLKVLNSNNNIITYSAFHPKHPWVFSSGEDNLIRLWT